MSTDRKSHRIAANAGAVLSKRDIAELFGVSVKTVSRWVQAGHLPPPCIRMTQRTIRWRFATIEPYLNGRRS